MYLWRINGILLLYMFNVHVMTTPPGDRSVNITVITAGCSLFQLTCPPSACSRQTPGHWVYTRTGRSRGSPTTTTRGQHHAFHSSKTFRSARYNYKTCCVTFCLTTGSKMFLKINAHSYHLIKCTNHLPSHQATRAIKYTHQVLISYRSDIVLSHYNHS